MGGRGARSAGGAGGTGAGAGNSEEMDLQKHFDSENARVEEFMKQPLKNGYASIEMENGNILEHYSMQYMKDMILKEVKDNGYGIDDEMVSILYKDGTVKIYSGGDDTSKMKLSNIEGVIYDNASTSAYAGKGIKIFNQKELYPDAYPHSKGYDDDWRIDFE